MRISLPVGKLLCKLGFNILVLTIVIGFGQGTAFMIGFDWEPLSIEWYALPLCLGSGLLLSGISVDTFYRWRIKSRS